MDVSRRRMLALIAGSIGLGSAVTACRAALETAQTPALSAPTTTIRPPTTTPPTTTSTRIVTTTPTPSLSLPETLDVIGREGWSSRPQGKFRYHLIERITVHHTAAEITANSQAPALIRQHEDWHMSHGWPGLAYHFMVDRNGNIYEGRPIEAVGDTFTEYNPTGHLLTCFEGHFDRQQPTDAQLSAMVRLIAWAMQTYSVPAGKVRGHRDWASTTCPGDNMYWRLDGLVRAAGDNGNVELSYLRANEAVERVAQIAAGG